MDILKALRLMENEFDKPAELLNGDYQSGVVTDPAYGSSGYGLDPKRPADKSVGSDIYNPDEDANIDPNENGEGDDSDSVNVKNKKTANESLSFLFSTMMNEVADSYKVNIKESSAPIFESIQLDEEFAAKALVIFESAINSTTKNHITALNKKAGDIMEKIISKKISLMETQVDKYLNSVIAEWTLENRLAIESGVRMQVAESFMEGLKGLLETHYIELPTHKKDLYEAAIVKGDEILGKYNEQFDKSVKLSEEVENLKKQLIVESSVQGMVATKAEKVRTLSKSLAFDSDFSNKIETIKEEIVNATTVSGNVEYITKDISPIVESDNHDKSDRIIERYMKFMDRI